MTNHLPECVCYDKVHAHKCALCICDRLRACEQRVNSSNLTMWNRTQQQAQQDRCAACRCHKPVGEECGICALLTPEEIAGVAAAITRHGNA